MRLLLVSVFVVFFPLFLSAEEQTSADKTTVFLQKFKAYQFSFLSARRAHLDKDNPWFGYLDRPFDQGLKESEKQDYLRFQAQGLCFNVGEYDLFGFLQQNPVLIGVFEKSSLVREQFYRISRIYSRGFQRCSALLQLRHNGFYEIEQSSLSQIKVETRGLSSPMFRWEKQKRALQDLFSAAICRDYLPAQQDILNWKLFKLQTLVADETIFYLFKRVERIKGPDAVSLKEPGFKKLVSKTPYRSVILDAAFTGDLTKLEYAMPFWYQTCLKKFDKVKFRKN